MDKILEKELVTLLAPVIDGKLTSRRKEKPIGMIFGRGFSLEEALDCAADTYIGVSVSLGTMENKLRTSQFVFWSTLTSLGLCVWCKVTPSSHDGFPR